jgi:hypothetical protein
MSIFNKLKLQDCKMMILTLPLERGTLKKYFNKFLISDGQKQSKIIFQIYFIDNVSNKVSLAVTC